MTITIAVKKDNYFTKFSRGNFNTLKPIQEIEHLIILIKTIQYG